MVEQIPFASLAKLSTAAPAAEDVTFCGSLQYYDKAFDRITPKEPRPLQRTKRAFRSPSTSDDPVIQCAALCTVCCCACSGKACGNAASVHGFGPPHPSTPSSSAPPSARAAGCCVVPAGCTQQGAALWQHPGVA